MTGDDRVRRNISLTLPKNDLAVVNPPIFSSNFVSFYISNFFLFSRFDGICYRTMFYENPFSANGIGIHRSIYKDKYTLAVMVLIFNLGGGESSS